jgi:hypothetical protein
VRANRIERLNFPAGIPPKKYRAHCGQRILRPAIPFGGHHRELSWHSIFGQSIQRGHAHRIVCAQSAA